MNESLDNKVLDEMYKLMKEHEEYISKLYQKTSSQLEETYNKWEEKNQENILSIFK